jgi:hypothetical protein
MIDRTGSERQRRYIARLRDRAEDAERLRRSNAYLRARIKNLQRELEEVHGGLSERGVHLLGFEELCQCGHEYGLHAPDPGTTEPLRCVAMDCECDSFKSENDHV